MRTDILAKVFFPLVIISFTVISYFFASNRDSIYLDAVATLPSQRKPEDAPLVIPPSPKDDPYNLQKPEKTYFSQHGQDEWLDERVHKKTGGFFIEAGGYDGEEFSNSLYFERVRGWNGILIEANPKLFQTIRSKHRKCYVTEGAISMSRNTEIVTFKLAGPIGGIKSALTPAWHSRIQKELSEGFYDWTKTDQGKGDDVDVTAYPLLKYLDEVHRQGGLKKDAQGRFVIDLFSLDTEGSELGIIKAIDFSRLLIGLMVIEIANNAIADQIMAFLGPKGYVEDKRDDLDLYVYSPEYFSKLA